MKVLLVNTGVFYLPPENSGGTEYHIYYIVNNLAKLGVKMCLISDITDKAYFHTDVVVCPINTIYFIIQSP